MLSVLQSHCIMTCQAACRLSVFCLAVSAVAGIVDWNPCRRSWSTRDSSGPPSYIAAVDSYVYVHCNSPDGGSYLMQCPGVMVWNPQSNGCTDFSGHSHTPPRMVGPLRGSNHAVRHTSTTHSPVSANHQHKFFEYGLPYSLLSSVSGPPSTLFRPLDSGGDLASQLTVNPCVVDDQGTLSPLRYHPHPGHPAKYLECVPEERSIVVRRCFAAKVWSQEIQSCVNRGSQVHPPQNRTVTDGGHHHHHSYQLIFGHRHRKNTDGAGAGHRNPCRRGGPSFYRPHPTSPSKYIQCSATGRFFVRKCPRGLRWNQRALTCDRSSPGTAHH